MRKTEKKEKLTPVRCVCSAPPVIVQNRGRKLISCPNPMRCTANLRTCWHGNEEAAIVEWNALVEAWKFRNA